MKLNIPRKSMLVLVLAVFGISSFAQLPEVQTRPEMSCMIGGVGSDESKALRAEAKKWPLNIEFSEHMGNKDAWVSGVRLKIMDAKKNTLFEESCNGPIFLAKLATGTYDIVASYQGVEKKRQIKIEDGKSQRVSINWSNKK
jgi:hypothetical protein